MRLATKVTGPIAGGPRQEPIRARWAGCVAQFCREEASNTMKILRAVFAFTAILIIVGGCVSPDISKLRHFDNLAIQGTPQFDEQVEKALGLLKTQSPAAYATVTNYVAIVQEDKHSGMEASHNPPIFQLNDRSAYYSVTWCAGVIAHDSFHSKLYHDYKKEHPKAIWVRKGVWQGAAAERLCVEHQLVVLNAIAAPASEIAWCRQCYTNRYWEVKYRKRAW
jgi:hypothetical protein